MNTERLTPHWLKKHGFIWLDGDEFQSHWIHEGVKERTGEDFWQFVLSENRWGDIRKKETSKELPLVQDLLDDYKLRGVVLDLSKYK